MKTVSIRLTQNDDGLFTVVAFGNTHELRVGQQVKQGDLDRWSGIARIRFQVIGMTRSESEDDNQAVMAGPTRRPTMFEPVAHDSPEYATGGTYSNEPF